MQEGLDSVREKYEKLKERCPAEVASLSRRRKALGGSLRCGVDA